MTPTTTPHGGTVLEPFTGQPIPAGCVVYGDDQGEWLVYAPGLRRAMRQGG